VSYACGTGIALLRSAPHSLKWLGNLENVNDMGMDRKLDRNAWSLKRITWLIVIVTLVVSVARAIIANLKLLLADEPTSNLHLAQGKEIMEVFWKLNGEGTTIIQATHSEINTTYGSRIVNLKDGWVRDDKEVAA